LTGFTAKRLEKAGRAIGAARRELAAGEPEFAAGHVYYAMFYTAEALLASRELTFSSHGAVHGAFGKEFVKSGELDAKFHRWLLAACSARGFTHSVWGAYHRTSPLVRSRKVAPESSCPSVSARIIEIMR
jgi:uncharacterized protein (UPF0332 family)